MRPSTRTLALLGRHLQLRPRTTLPATRATTKPTARPSSTFSPGPSPPRLPADQQAEFERLQREASVADFSSPSSSDADAAAATAAAIADQTPKKIDIEETATATSGGIRKGAPPEFEGDVNPKTGEVGGPKNEPLRWGAGGDYSYNGRVTDF